MTRDTLWRKRLFPPYFIRASHYFMKLREITSFLARFIIWRRRRWRARAWEFSARDVIISRPKFHDNGWVLDFRASVAQKSLIKLSSDRGRYLAIISLRDVLWQSSRHSRQDDASSDKEYCLATIFSFTREMEKYNYRHSVGRTDSHEPTIWNSSRIEIIEYFRLSLQHLGHFRLVLSRPRRGYR